MTKDEFLHVLTKTDICDWCKLGRDDENGIPLCQPPRPEGACEKAKLNRAMYLWKKLNRSKKRD